MILTLRIGLVPFIRWRLEIGRWTVVYAGDRQLRHEAIVQRLRGGT